MKRVAFAALLLLVFFLCIFAQSLQASWIADGYAVCTAAGVQQYPAMIPDGEGGAFITWQDSRSGVGDIYVQHVNAAGTAMWTAGGVLVCGESAAQANPQITSDGAGGVIIAWRDFRDALDNIYARRVNASGNPLWIINGNRVCASTEAQRPMITSDGAGGAIITWYDRRSGDYDVYVQRMDASGNYYWTYNGLALCAATGTQSYPEIVSDGAGGAIVTWYDNRSGNYDIYAQRVSPSGSVYWTSNGLGICLRAGQQLYPRIISDGAAGAIITWYDDWSGNYDIYAQRLEASGAAAWPANGLAVCTLQGDQSSPRIISDGAGGAIIAWYDQRSSTYGGYGLYAQRIDASGDYQWTSYGSSFCARLGALNVASDGEGGVIATWAEFRTTNYDIYAQRMDSSGTVRWLVDGTAICAAGGDQQYQVIIPDGAGGAIVAWNDQRVDANTDIYAQQIDRKGRIGYLPPVIHSVRDVPGDQGGGVYLAWDASPYDYLSGQITRYTVWRALDPEAAALLLEGGAVVKENPGDITGLEAEGRRAVLMTASAQSGYYWELLGSHDAYYLEGYSAIVPTAFDSSAATDEYSYFQVIAHTSVPMTFYVSEPDSGYSVDNLAPAAPLGLSGEQLFTPGGLRLTWDPNSEPDLAGYSIYRGTSAGFVPGPGNFVTSTPDTAAFDGGWDWAAGYWYKVAAVDVHGNESVFALIGPDMVTGEDPMPLPGATFLAQNFPNPFNPNTSIAFGLKEAGSVNLSVYDAAGRLVATLVDESMPAGNYSVEWNGLGGSGSKAAGGGGSRAASGVYFYRLKAGDFVETRKMVLLK